MRIRLGNSFRVGVFMLLVTGIYGQSNIAVGYKLGYSPAENVVDIFNRFNAANNFIQEPFPDPTLHNGLIFGYRYRLGNAALELSWSNMGSDQKAVGRDELNNITINKRIGWSFTQYDAGLQFFVGSLSFGGGIGHRRITTDTDVDGVSDVNREIFKQSELVANAQIGVEVSSKYISFAIQPYITFPLASTEVQALDVELLGDPNIEPIEEDFLMFGVKLVLYNGPSKKK